MYKKAFLFFVLAYGVIPMFAHAQSNAPANWWRIITPPTAGVQAKVDELSDTMEQNLKIPVLIAIAPGSFKNNYGVVYTNGSIHQGQDIFAPRGSYVVSPTDAVVTRIDRTGAGGIAVYTANPGRETFYYAHLTAVGPTIHVGAQLDPGDLIGYVGNTGDAEGSSPHLHFQIFTLSDAGKTGGPIDPNPRLTKTFSDDERIEALGKIIDRSDNKTLAAHAIVTLYKDFLSSLSADKLPAELADALDGAAPTTTSRPEKNVSQTQTINPPSVADAKQTSSTSPGMSIRNNLMLGMRTDEVKVLQAYIIKRNAGMYAQTLAGYGATGYYGILTKAAVIEFQRSVGISGSGMVGPLTRAYIASHQ